MALGRLSPLQERVLIALADLRPPWTLTGGGALAGFHTKHRETRDLDVFFHGQQSLGEIVTDAIRTLQVAGLAAVPLRSSATFGQLSVRDASDAVVVDLVADPTPRAEPPRPAAVGDTTILVETPHQLLVNKLNALLSRSEVRDLVDVRALLAAGGDLTRALGDCPDQDAGFSPLTFSWATRGLPVSKLAKALGWTDADAEELERFRDGLVEQVLVQARPE